MQFLENNKLMLNLRFFLRFFFVNRAPWRLSNKGSLGLHKLVPQTSSPSVQPFLHSWLVCQKVGQTDHAVCSIVSNRPYLYTTCCWCGRKTVMLLITATFSFHFTGLLSLVTQRSATFRKSEPLG